MMSYSAGDTDCRPTRHARGEEEDGLALQWNEAGGHETLTKERIACDRCRQRKTKCDRVNPCAHCVKSGAQCSFRFSHKAKEKRQRVLISSVYERRLEHISNKIDELGDIIGQLREERRRDIPPVPMCRSLQSSTLGAWDQPRFQPAGIESTLFGNVFFAAEALQTAVMNEPYSTAIRDMTLALDALWRTVNVQRERNEALERSCPFPNMLPPDKTVKDLPIPSMDKIMACLRVAQESSPSQLYWPAEFGSLGDFTRYVIKACSPGPITDMELIIVHYILEWLFTECSIRDRDEKVKQDHKSQALICRNSLETILSSLPFHIDTNIDSITALYMATIHCLRRGKAFAAWTFISRASLMSQAMEFHSSHATATTEPGERSQRNIHLFWAVYALEKPISLRLGRRSTIRDEDITVPRLAMDRKMASVAHNRLPDWIDFASLYGRLYDELYSPSALAQPASIRDSRTKVLASELELMIAVRDEYYKCPDQWSNHLIHPSMSMFIIHANKAIEYSTLASIYQGSPVAAAFSEPPCVQCIAAARVSLDESGACITILSDTETWPDALESWINEILLLAPFMPFLILVRSVVQTCDASDMARLQRLIDGLYLLTQSPRYSSCNRQLRIFKAMYDVVMKHVQAKAQIQPREVAGQPNYSDIETALNGDAWFDTALLDTHLFPVNTQSLDTAEEVIQYQGQTSH
ncbi:hypothetical protein BJY01DRAFT_34159 [Aspergillus pseudoustus]|uniref:Zn(2)-C6 fungal-type domain-containing protein n=1 Tax=Aspergillus pseudoustus TaxID=1810923 RepID=A0ABR4JEV1_9EURO